MDESEILHLPTQADAFNTARAVIPSECKLFKATDGSQQEKDLLELLFNNYASEENYKKDIVEFWLQFRFQDGGILLFDFVRHIYGVPASTANVERLFSLVANIITKSRNRIGMDLVQATCIVKDETLEAKHARKVKKPNMKVEKELSSVFPSRLDYETGNVTFAEYVNNYNEELYQSFYKSCMSKNKK